MKKLLMGDVNDVVQKFTKKNLKQWMLKITEYAQRLLDDLEGLDWPEKVKKMQSLTG